VESLESELERARDALTAAEEETATLAATIESLTAGIEQARELLR
jgi:multidrug resistance efflux pump